MIRKMMGTALIVMILLNTACNGVEQRAEEVRLPMIEIPTIVTTPPVTEVTAIVTMPPVTEPTVIRTAPPVIETTPPVIETSPPSPANNVVVSDSPLQRASNLAAESMNSAGVDNSWALWLINANNPMPPGSSPNLTLIGTYNSQNRYLDSRAAPFALLMMEAARNDGITLTLVSTFRSIERQTINFLSRYENAISRGLSPDAAFDYTASMIAIPGTSEHNAGVAIDFNWIDERFDQTETFRWLRDNAHNFGFILRYPRNTTHITGIIYEPWHFRFVGLYHAAKIHESGLTLEEYMGVCAGDNSVVAAFRNQTINR